MPLFRSSGRARAQLERTAAERERARAERARRRALADGVAPPPQAAADPTPPQAPAEPTPPPGLVEAQPPPDPVDSSARPAPLPPLPPPLEAFVPHAPAEGFSPRAVVDTAGLALAEPEPQPEPEPPPEPRAQADRKARAQARRDARRQARHRARAQTSRGRRAVRRGGAAGALLLAVALVVFAVALFQPFHGRGTGRVTVTIPKGAGTGRIGSILAHDGVVSSSLLFEIRVLLEGKRGALHSGTFELRHDMSYSGAIAALGREPPPAVARVTVPEGYTRAQIAALASADGLRGSYLHAARASRAFSPSAYGAPARTSTLEGFLFPATYELSTGAPSSQLVSEQLQAFRRHFGSTQRRRARVLGVTPYGLLTIASMIEREAMLPRDRPLVAAVIYNRLRVGMTLGIDATIRYALGNYEQPLTEAQLRVDSPYNTRLRRGLPPTPISNPGVASIEAAAHPARAPYLYYVNGADGCGELVFSSSYAQFERNAQAYQEALHRNGGRVPTCHHH